MTDHFTQWLGAYHDGELRAGRLRRVEEHLAGCAECRAELDEIQALSTLLQVRPPETAFISAERFAAGLVLQLPRRPQSPQQRPRFEIGWWLVPVGLLATWVFIGITVSLSNTLGLAANSGLFHSSLAWLQGNPAQMGWFTSAMSLFGEQMGASGRTVLATLSDANVFIVQLLKPLLLQAVLAVAYLGWLFVWWLQHQESPQRAVLMTKK